MTTSSQCDESRLTALLYDHASSDLYQSAAQHLEQCARCRERLTELAADAATWRETGAQLRELPERYPHRDLADDCPQSMPIKLDFLAAPAHPEMLGRMGRYDIERVVGAGGMGIVLKAHDTDLNRPVAVKVMAPHLAHSGAARQRFAREARAAAAVVHEHVVAIYDVVADAEAPYLVMQYVPGHSLQTRLDECGALSVAEVLRIGIQAALGLEAAHAQGLVHRDIKPANILLQDGVERITLTDFGLARAVDDATMTHSGIIAGTPQYMSPEQARGELVDHRSDLFSLGSVMYAMCTGRPPFRAETTMGVLRRISDSEPHAIEQINAEIPPWLVAIIQKLLNKDPSERFSSAADIAQLLEGCLKHWQQPKSVSLPGLAADLIQPVQKNRCTRKRVATWTAGLVLAASIFAVGVSAWQRFTRTNAPGENSQQTIPSPSRGASASSPGAWEDGVTERLEELGRRVELLEQQWP